MTEARDRPSPAARRYWRSLEERAGDPAEPPVEKTFPDLTAGAPTDRRRFMQYTLAALMAKSLGGATEAAADERAVPFVRQPERVVPGVPRFYATVIPFAGWAQPVLVETHSGRPTRLDGNADHPIGTSAADPFTQAAVLQLYDPDRSTATAYQGDISSWGVFAGVASERARRLRETGGEGFRILIEATSSPTLMRQLAALREAYPRARIHVFEPVGTDLAHAGTARAFGTPLDIRYRLEQARAVVSLEADLLGPGPAQIPNAAAWSTARIASHHSDEPRPHLHVAEATPTLTGAMADDRLFVASGRIPLMAAALAARILDDAPSPPANLSEAETRWVEAAGQALREAGPRGLLAAGAHLPPDTQALAHLVNHALGNTGRTVAYVEPVLLRPRDRSETLQALADDMEAGSVETLLVLGANPAYTAPADLNFGERLDNVPLRIHAGLYYDETASLSHWHIPLAHPLESWSDHRARDGTASIQQPTVRTLHGGRTAHEIVALFLDDSDGEGDGDGGGDDGDAHAMVRRTWRDRLGADGFAERWRRALHDGYVPDTAAAPQSPAPALSANELSIEAPPEARPEIVFRPDPTIWDGRFASLGWLQELPKPLTKLTWDNVVAISPALARELSVETGEVVTLSHGGRSLSGPAWVLPGQAPQTVTLYLGYGRRRGAGAAIGRGYDAYRLRPSGAHWLLHGATIEPTGGRAALATTQQHDTMEPAGEPARTVPETNATIDDEEEEPASLYPHWPGNKDEQHAWAMAIDLDLCIGCSACTLACQAENNIPVVGQDEVLRGRHMQWIRVDRYYTGSAEDPQTLFQPIPCMHCEKAPCELGCPVNATVHSPDGLNEMIYNRCIGTRTCASYCPYKVRRFNYYAYAEMDIQGQRAQYNPDVTVRGRGVMEKCTYCVQRISAARIAAKKEGRDIRDGEVVTACQAACPTSAIVFGNAADPDTAVNRRKRNGRDYALLKELGTRPRTTYQARIVPPDSEGEAE